MIRFVKAHACGNDFLIVDEPLEESRYSKVAQTLCTRNTGVGADGVEYLTLGDNGSFAIRLFNADGSRRKSLAMELGASPPIWRSKRM